VSLEIKNLQLIFSEKFEVIPLPSDHSDVRQIHGRPGQIWGAKSGLDRIMVIRTGN
jgi:Streptogramin lyase